jgi:hypothetical protein
MTSSAFCLVRSINDKSSSSFLAKEGNYKEEKYFTVIM